MTPEEIRADVLAQVRAEVHDEVRRGRRRDRLVLTSWGLAVLVLAGLFSAWVATNDRQQDRDMCSLVGVLLAGPEPVPGPLGERQRIVRDAINRYYENRHCPPR